MTPPTFYARPGGHRYQLHVRPTLASWDKAGSPGRMRQDAFIDHAWSIMTGSVTEFTDPLSVWLEIGLPEEMPLLARNDLDNYLFPLVPTLAKRAGR